MRKELSGDLPESNAIVAVTYAATSYRPIVTNTASYTTPSQPTSQPPNLTLINSHSILHNVPQVSPSTPWIDFMLREQAIKEAQATQQKFLDCANNDIPTQRIQEPHIAPVVPHTRAPSNFLTFNQAINLIPQFDGNPDNLNLFCAAVERVMATFGREHEEYIIFALASKLIGRAADGYKARLTSYIDL